MLISHVYIHVYIFHVYIHVLSSRLWSRGLCLRKHLRSLTYLVELVDIHSAQRVEAE